MSLSTRNKSPRRCTNLNWRVSLRHCAIAQLTELVLAQRPKGSVQPHTQRVMIPSGNSCEMFRANSNRRISFVVDTGDEVARWGGDEFAVCLARAGDDGEIEGEGANHNPKAIKTTAKKKPIILLMGVSTASLLVQLLFHEVLLCIPQASLKDHHCWLLRFELLTRPHSPRHQ